MTDENDSRLGFSRRKLLGSMATIGAASAIGGAGTMAFFSDEENFANNQLTAGELDLKVDWSEHYSDWSEDEADDINNVSMDPFDGATGFPQTAPAQSVYVSDPNQFLTNTAVEAYPDPDDDNVQDPFAAEPGGTTDKGVGYVCTDGADTPEDLDPNGGTNLRTDNPIGTAARGEATVGENDEPLPLVYINDVKPGDFGEVTFSIHLCDNPGYVWLTGELVEELTGENGFTEPELKDPDEDGEDTSELLDELRVSMWYDYVAGSDNRPNGGSTDGDNLKQSDEFYIVRDVRLDNLLDLLGEGVGLPLDANPDSTGGATLTCEDTSGNSEWQIQIPSDFDTGNQTVVDVSGESWSTTPNGVVTINQVRDPDGDGDIDGFDFQYNAADEQAGEGACEVVITKDGDTEDYAYGCAEDVNNVSIIGPDAETETIDDLAGATVGFDNCVLDPDDPERDCFQPSSTYYFGFEWYLPVDHANEIQTDSVAWDLGFYTEQCRHNDGSGQAPE